MTDSSSTTTAITVTTDSGTAVDDGVGFTDTDTDTGAVATDIRMAVGSSHAACSIGVWSHTMLVVARPPWHVVERRGSHLHIRIILHHHHRWWR